MSISKSLNLWQKNIRVSLSSRINVKQRFVESIVLDIYFNFLKSSNPNRIAFSERSLPKGGGKGISHLGKYI